MNNRQQISAGQLVAVLLTSRLAVSMTFAPTVHQLSHGGDFLISLVIQGLLLALLYLPVWWFSRRSKGISTVDYCLAVMGRGGGAVAVLYALICLYVQVADLLRFSRFADTVLSPDMSRAVLIVALMATAGIAAFYGIQAIARSAAILAVFVTASILLAALALIPRMETVNFPPFLYDGLPPVLSGALEELPRSMELAAVGLLLPYVKGSMAKSWLWWCGGFTAVALVIQVSVVGVLGDFGELEAFPYYTAVTSLHVGVLQRLDIVATAVWIGALFLKTAFFGLLFVDCFQRVTGPKGRLPVAAAGSAAAVILALLLGNRLPLEKERTILWTISTVLLALCAVALPVFLSVWDMAREKKNRRPLGLSEEDAV